MEVDLCNQCDVDPDFIDDSFNPVEEIIYDCTVDPVSDDCVWGALCWPHELLTEMGISIPNACIWVTKKDETFDQGLGYPIYLEDNYLTELQEVLDSTIWDKDSVDIKILADKHAELRDIIEERTKRSMVDTFDFEESALSDLTFSLFQLSIKKEGGI